MTLRIKILVLENKRSIQLLSSMMDVFTPKRISRDCPFKSNQRLTNISILTPRCAIWLRRVMHTEELDSAEGCTLQSLTPQWNAHRGAFWEILITWLPGVMHTAELDSTVGCTPGSLTSQWDAHRGVRLVRICLFFVFSYMLQFSTPFFEKLLK